MEARVGTENKGQNIDYMALLCIAIRSVYPKVSPFLPRLLASVGLV